MKGNLSNGVLASNTGKFTHLKRVGKSWPGIQRLILSRIFIVGQSWIVYIFNHCCSLSRILWDAIAEDVNVSWCGLICMICSEFLRFVVWFDIILKSVYDLCLFSQTLFHTSLTGSHANTLMGERFIIKMWSFSK